MDFLNFYSAVDYDKALTNPPVGRWIARHGIVIDRLVLGSVSAALDLAVFLLKKLRRA